MIEMDQKRIALLTKKNFKAQRNYSAANFKTLIRNAVFAIAEVALCAFNCALPTSVINVKAFSSIMSKTLFFG